MFYECTYDICKENVVLSYDSMATCECHSGIRGQAWSRPRHKYPRTESPGTVGAQETIFPIAVILCAQSIGKADGRDPLE